MALIDIRCCERDLALALELAADLPVQDLLVGFDGQQEVDPVLQAPAKMPVSCEVRPASGSGRHLDKRAEQLLERCLLTGFVGVIGGLGQRHPAGAIEVRVGVALFWLAVGGTARMTDTALTNRTPGL